MIGLLSNRWPTWRACILPKSSWRCSPGRLHATKAARCGEPLKLWTKEEDDLIIKLFEQGMRQRDIQELVPGRSHSAVMTRAYKVLVPKGLISTEPRKRFTPEEDAKLLQLAAQRLSFPAIKQHFPDRPSDTLRERLHGLQEELGGGRSKQGKVFTPAEDAKLLHLREAERMTWIKVAQQMPGRTRQQLCGRYLKIRPPSARIHVLGEGRYSDENRDELSRLKKSGLTHKAIAEKFATNAHAISHRIQAMRHAAPQAKRRIGRWSKQEDEDLRRLRAAGQSERQIFHSIDGRSLSSIEQRWRRLKEMDLIAKIKKRE